MHMHHDKDRKICRLSCNKTIGGIGKRYIRISFRLKLTKSVANRQRGKYIKERVVYGIVCVYYGILYIM